MAKRIIEGKIGAFKGQTSFQPASLHVEQQIGRNHLTWIIFPYIGVPFKGFFFENLVYINLWKNYIAIGEHKVQIITSFLKMLTTVELFEI